MMNTSAPTDGRTVQRMNKIRAGPGSLPRPASEDGLHLSITTGLTGKGFVRPWDVRTWYRLFPSAQ